MSSKHHYQEEERRYGVPKLNNSNYYIWKQKVELLLIKEELWEVLETPIPDNPDENWLRKDKLARATIGLLIEDKHLVDIRNEETALGIWRKLERTHQRDNIGTRLMLYRTLFTARYNTGEDIEDHLSYLMNTAAKLEDRGYPVPTEILCSAVLGSLPREYNPLITTIEGRNAEDITMEYIKSKIMEEAARQKHVPNSSTRALNSEERKGPRRDNNHLQCYYCKKIGHIRRDCRILKKHEAHQPMKGNRIRTRTNYPSNKEKQQIKITTNREPDSSPETKERSYAETTNVILAHKALTVQQPAQEQNNNRWIIDTGARSHMCKDLDKLSEVETISKNVTIMTASGQQYKVTKKGNSCITVTTKEGENTTLVLTDVLYVPELTDNLISISKLDQEGLEIFFKEKRSWIVYNKKKYKIGELKDNLYIWEEEKEIIPNNLCHHIWHKRLGHRDINFIKRTYTTTKPKGLHIDECTAGQLCHVCQTTKKHHEKFETIKNRVPDRPFHTIHADLCGPVTPRSIGGNRYALSIIDDYSRFTKVYLISHKDQSTDFVKQYIEEGINKFGRRPLVLRTDGGGEFQNNNLNNYLSTKGIKHKLSIPYMHQQNGLIERYNRTLMEGIRALLKEAKLSDQLWGEMASTTTYLNNLILRANQTKTPYELWHGTTPNYDHLRVIGSKCYFINNNPNKSKLDDRGIQGILIGYGRSRSFYRILNLNNNTIHESRGVTFEPETCPYQIPIKTKEEITIDEDDKNQINDEPETESLGLELRKSSRVNRGKPPQTLTYNEQGTLSDSQKDWYVDHNLQRSKHNGE